MIKKKNGQALVEFIIILPVMVFLIFGLFDFGIVISEKNTLTNCLNDVVDMVNDHKNNNEIRNILKLDRDIELNMTSENGYTTIILKKEQNLITPGVNQILGNPYYIEVKRVIKSE